MFSWLRRVYCVSGSVLGSGIPAPMMGPGAEAEAPGLNSTSNPESCLLVLGAEARLLSEGGLGRKASWLLSGACKIAFDDLSVNK